MTKRPEKADQVYVQHMIECIEKINTYTKQGKSDFMHSTLIQDAVIRNLQIIGDASKKLS